MSLTQTQLDKISQARTLAGVSGPDAIREYADTDDLTMGYAMAYGAARDTIAELVAMVEQLIADDTVAELDTIEQLQGAGK